MDIAYEVVRYAMLAASYLLTGLSAGEIKRLRSAILFGSVAQGRATPESDVDLFFDVAASKRAQKRLRAKLNKAAEAFYLSSPALEFKLKGIANEVSVTVGRLEEWPELSRSIAAAGIVLYGKYLARPPGLKAYTILSWERPGKAKGAFLNKIYGYHAGKRRYPGLLEKSRGVKLGKATIMIPAANRGLFIEALEKYKIDYSRQDVWA